MRLLLLLMTWIVASGITACEGPAFGGGDLPSVKADDRSLDLSGTDQPADLPTADEAAMAAAGITRIVEATAEVADALADAVGDLFPSEDNPCPGGGSASSDLSGSLNHPRIRMEFHQCMRGEIMLDGIAAIRCNDLDGSDCKAGDVSLGEGKSLLLYSTTAAQRAHSILMHGAATVTNDSANKRLKVFANLQGEARAAAEQGPRFSFITKALTVNLQETAGDQTELRIDGVAGLGGGAADARCISGQFDTETPSEPLILQGRIIRSGRLRLHSPPPRPGEQQAEAAFVEGGASVLGADGVQKVYSSEDLAGFCSVQ